MILFAQITNSKGEQTEKGDNESIEVALTYKGKKIGTLYYQTEIGKKYSLKWNRHRTTNDVLIQES